MDTPKERPRNFYFSPVWTIGNVLFLLVSLGSLVATFIGGLIVITKMQDTSAQIPSLISTTKEHGLAIAVLQDQQRNLDSKYSEIMLQLSRLDAKLDKQNEYLFDSLQHLDGKQKNSYRPRNFLIPGISAKVSTVGVGNTAPPQ